MIKNVTTLLLLVCSLPLCWAKDNVQVAPLQAEENSYAPRSDAAPESLAVALLTAAPTFQINITTSGDEVIFVDWGDTSPIEQFDAQKERITRLKHKFADAQTAHNVRIYAHTITALEAPLFAVLELKDLDVSHCPMLQKLSLPYGNDIPSLDLSANPLLCEVELSGCQLKELMLPSAIENLKILKLIDNNLRSIDLKGAVNLEVLKLSSNFLAELDLSHVKKIKKLDVKQNKLHAVKGLSMLNLLDELDISSNFFPFSEIPAKGAMSTYRYSQYWFEIPENLVNGNIVDLSREDKARGLSDKEEQTVFEWYILGENNEKTLIDPRYYTNQKGVFTFLPSFFEEKQAHNIFVIMKSPAFPDINKKVGGLRSADVKVSYSDQLIDPSQFDDTFEGLYEDAFLNARKLKKILLPPNTKEIRTNAFEGCEALSKIGLQADATIVSSSFIDQEGLKIYVPTQAIKETFDAILQFQQSEVIVGDLTSGSRLAASSITYILEGNVLTIDNREEVDVDIALYNVAGDLLKTVLLPAHHASSFSMLSSTLYILKVRNTYYKIIAK